MSAAEPDAIIVTAVREVLNRFGPTGLRELIDLATDELSAAESTMSELVDHEAEDA